MKNQLKKQMILFFLLFSGMMASFAQSGSSLNGTWKLEKVEKFKKENIDYLPVKYTKTASSNMHEGIYETLKFQNDQCETLINEQNLSNIYKVRANQLDLYFSPLVESYDWSVENNTLTLTRVYPDVDDANAFEVAEYKVILTYKQK